MKKLICIAFVSLFAQSVMAEQSLPDYGSPRFYGYLRYDAETVSQDGSGLYSIDVVPEGRVKVVDLSVAGTGGGCYGDNRYYVVDYTQSKYGELTSVKLKVYDPADWTVLEEKEIPQTSIPTTMTYNPVESTIYGCFFNNETDKPEFGTLSKADGSTTVIKVLETSISAMACNHKGELYAIDANGDLLRYIPSTSDFELVGKTGLTPKYLQDAAFDYGTKQLYWFAMTDNEAEAGIYIVDLSTGKATRVTEYATGEKEFSGVFSMTPVYADGVPAMVPDCSMSINSATMGASVKFVMPVETYGGQSLSGTLDYEVIVDGTTVKSGSAPVGGNVDAGCTLTRGDRVVSVRAVNDAGAGPDYIIREFVGYDEPAKVKNLAATRIEDGIKVSWDLNPEGAHGKPVDKDNIRYTVTRMPDGVTVASSISATECVDVAEREEPSLVYYEVEAADGSYVSAKAASNQVMAGKALAVPFAYDFRDKPGFGLFTVIDNNGDGNSWIFRDKYGVVNVAGRVDADDWLVTPPVTLEKGTKYKLTVSLGVAMDTEVFEIRYGKGSGVAAMTETAVEPTEIDDIDAWYRDVWDEPGNIVAYVTPTDDGEYCFGIHAISPAGTLFLYCCDFAIDKATPVGLGVVGVDVAGPQIVVESGRIVVTGAEGDIDIYSVSGTCVGSCKAVAGEAHVFNLGKGVYVLKTVGHVSKVMVR